MMSYIKETDFVIENKQLVYPEVIMDGLQLYYDAKGKRDTDYHRDTMLDMSGNKNHGTLHNFAYEKHSGYKDGLVFDYIDDKLVRPLLNLQPNDFTFMLNGNIISFSPDGTVKRVQDGEVIESKGFNLVRNGDFVNGINGWNNVAGRYSVVGYKDGGVILRTDSTNARLEYNVDANQTDIYYYSVEAESNKTDVFLGTQAGALASYNSQPNRQMLSYLGTISYRTLSLGASNVGSVSTFYNPIAINLTETFGAGNEPTKEQMDEIINRFGFIPNAQDLIDRIEYKGNDLGDMENIIDGLYKTDVLSGEEVYTDKADDAVVHVEVDGKSYQHAGSGKNLFTLSYPDALEDFSKPVDYWVKPITLKANTEYTLSAKLVGNLIQDTTVIVWNGGDRYADRGQGYTILTVNGVERTAGFNTEGATEWKIAIYLKNDLESSKKLLGELLDNYQFQLEEGSITTAYEPPAPTPDYPIEIKSVNDFDVVSSVGKRNSFLSSDSISLTNNGSATKNISSKKSESGDIRIELPSGWGENINEIVFRADVYLKKSERYTLSFLMETDSIITGNVSIQNWVANTFYPSSSIRNISTNRYKVSQTFITKDNLDGILKGQRVFDLEGILRSFRDSGTFVEFKNIKIEKGAIVTPYSLAPEDIAEDDNHPLIDKINLLLDEPLRSVGNVKDRLFRDSDGLWKVERNIAQYVFTGNETFGSNAVYGAYYNTENSVNNEYIVGVYSNYLKASTGRNLMNREKNAIGLANNSSAIRMSIVIDGTQLTHDTIKPWLSQKYEEGKPLVMQYLLNKPTTDILPISIQDKLNNLRSFSESNYVYTIDGDTNLLDTVPLLDNHWYNNAGVLQDPSFDNSTTNTATEKPLSVYPGAKIKLTKITAGDNYWRIVWVDKDNNFILRETSADNNLVVTTPSGAYGMRVSYPKGSNPAIKFVKIDTFDKLNPTLHAKFLYNNWYKEDRVINNLMIYNRALTNEEMLQNYKMIKRRWRM